MDSPFRIRIRTRRTVDQGQGQRVPASPIAVFAVARQNHRFFPASCSHSILQRRYIIGQIPAFHHRSRDIIQISTDRIGNRNPIIQYGNDIPSDFLPVDGDIRLDSRLIFIQGIDHFNHRIRNFIGRLHTFPQRSTGRLFQPNTLIHRNTPDVPADLPGTGRVFFRFNISEPCGFPGNPFPAAVIGLQGTQTPRFCIQNRCYFVVFQDPVRIKGRKPLPCLEVNRIGFGFHFGKNHCGISESRHPDIHQNAEKFMIPILLQLSVQKLILHGFPVRTSHGNALQISRPVPDGKLRHFPALFRQGVEDMENSCLSHTPLRSGSSGKVFQAVSGAGSFGLGIIRIRIG